MSKQTFNLDGAVVAITGSARGIGKATAEAFARHGARVAIGDLDATLAKQAAMEIGRGAIALPLDVTDRSSVDAFIAQTEEQLGPIDVYVNNAGIGPVALIGDESDELAEKIFAVNVHGTLYGMKAVLPRMLARRRGHIVNIASAAGKLAFPGAVTYCGSKFAVVGITEAARLELHGSPVRLSMVSPGVANTELASGVKNTRGVPRAEPHQVASAVVDAVRHNRFEVFVPQRLGPISKLMTVVPRTLREMGVRALGLDRMLLDVDESVRRTYNERTMPSTPERKDAKISANERTS